MKNDKNTGTKSANSQLAALNQQIEDLKLQKTALAEPFIGIGSVPLRQTVRGAFLTVRPYGFTPKHRNARPDGLKSNFPNSGQLFWFLFWF